MTKPDTTSTTTPVKKAARRPQFKTAAVVGPTADDVLVAPAATEPAAVAAVDPETVAPAPVSKAAVTPAATGKGDPGHGGTWVRRAPGAAPVVDRYADEIGVAQVAGAETFRALLQLALDDETVAHKLGKALARTGGSRRHT